MITKFNIDNQLITNIAKKIYIERNLISHIYDIANSHSDTPFLVADHNTVAILNKNLLTKFNHYIIPNFSTASIKLINLIINKAKNANLLVALGSGTINDICKYISNIEDKNYILFPTAASMNGYTSINASIELENGLKKSFQGKLAEAIYIDINVIVNAPSKLTTSGFADFICRSTAQADWLLSNLLLNTQYTELPFLITQEIEKELIRTYRGLMSKDEQSILILMEALLLSGFGMIIAESSCPASQGEHMIANAMELSTPPNKFLLHGEKIAVTTLTMANLQQKILSLAKAPQIKHTSITQENIISCFGQKYSKEFIKVYTKKFIDHNKAQFLNDIINHNWAQIVNKINENFLSTNLIKKMFHKLNCPVNIETLLWNKNHYNKITNLAFITRDRFTFLDLAHHINYPINFI